MNKTKELLKDLDERIEQVKSSEEFREILEFFSRFHQYSYRNQMLIQMQKPDATYLAGYRQWQKKFDRYVKKGEEGIGILAPFTYKDTETEIVEVETTEGTIKQKEIEKEVRKTYFRTVYVFDISQTEGEEPVPELDLSLEDKEIELLDPLKSFAVDQNNIKLKFKPLEKESLNGYSKGGEIVVDSKLNGTEKASTIVHELSHELLHDKEKRIELSKEVKEMEAEATAFVVMKHYEIEIKSDKYLALYKEAYDLEESLKRIHDVSTKIIGGVKREKEDNS